MPQLLHREVFDDALFDLVEVVVILVEHAARFDRIEPVLAGLLPWDVEQPVEVRADHLVFGRRRSHPLQAIDFAKRDGLDSLRQMGFGDSRAQLLGLAVAFAKLALNGLHLLPQQVLALRVAHLLFGARFDLAFELEHLDLPRKRVRDGIELDEEAVLLEQLLFVVRLHVEEAREQIRQAQRIVEARYERLDVRGEPRCQRESAVDELLQTADVRVDLDRTFGRLRHRRDVRLHEPAFGLQLFGLHTRDALHQNAHAILCRRHLPHDGDGSDAVQIVRSGVVRLGSLQQQQHHAVARQRAVDGLDRHRTAHAERRDRQRQHDGAANRDHREDGWKLRRVRHSRSQCI